MNRRFVGVLGVLGVVLGGHLPRAEASPWLRSAVPKGADFSLALSADQVSSLFELQTRFGAQWKGRSRTTDLLDRVLAGVEGWSRALEAQAGASLVRDHGGLLLWVDFRDNRPPVTGGMVWPGSPPSVRSGGGDVWKSFKMDNQEFYQRPGDDFCWGTRAEAVVFGDCLGMKRQWRHKGPGAIPAPSGKELAGFPGLRWRAPESVQGDLAELLGAWGAFLVSVESGELAAAPEGFVIHLEVKSEVTSLGVERGLKALMESLVGEVSLHRARAELVRSLEALGAEELKKRLQAHRGEFAAIKEAAPGAPPQAPVEVYRRPGGKIEGRVEVSDYELWANMGVVLLLKSELGRGRLFSELAPERVLGELLELELRHKERTGEFVLCEAAPSSLPGRPIRWPRQSCFDALNYRPTGVVDYQLSATLERGQLVLVLREDVGGDGIPTVWVLGERASGTRRFGPAD